MGEALTRFSEPYSLKVFEDRRDIIEIGVGPTDEI
jgi:hypothetical protein